MIKKLALLVIIVVILISAACSQNSKKKITKKNKEKNTEYLTPQNSFKTYMFALKEGNEKKAIESLYFNFNKKKKEISQKSIRLYIKRNIYAKVIKIEFEKPYYPDMQQYPNVSKYCFLTAYLVFKKGYGWGKIDKNKHRVARVIYLIVKINGKWKVVPTEYAG